MTVIANRFTMNIVITAVALLLAGCNEEKEDAGKFKPVNSAGAKSTPAAPASPPRAPTTAPARPSDAARPLTSTQIQRGELPPGHPPIDRPPAPSTAPAKDAPRASGGEVSDGGLKFTIPESWQAQTPTAVQFGPKLQYALPHLESDKEDAFVKIYHYPNMRGADFDGKNIERWIGQMELPSGTPKPEVKETTQGDVSLKTLDMTGTFKGGGPMMGSSGGPQENYRVITVIVNHPDGPHHIKVTGPKATVEKWKPSIDAFIASIKPAGGAP